MYYNGVQLQLDQLITEGDSHIVYQVSKFRQVNFRGDPTVEHKSYSVLGGITYVAKFKFGVVPPLTHM